MLARQQHRGAHLKRSTRRLLHVIDETWKLPVPYYRGFACLLHIIRDNAHALYSYWPRTYGAVFVRYSGIWKIAPRPISIRWGRKGLLKDYVLRLPLDKLQESLFEVLTSRNYFREQLQRDLDEIGRNLDGMFDLVGDDGAVAPPKNKGKGKGRGRGRGRKQGLDQCATDETGDFKKRMSKWVVMALKAVRCEEFWVVCCISNRISHTLDILLWTIQQARKPGEVHNLARLLYGKADDIYVRVAELLKESGWAALAHVCGTEQTYNKLIGCTTKLVLRVMGDFRRRILHRLFKWPVQFLWFCFNTPDVQCKERLRIAKYLLDVGAEAGKLETNAAKIRFCSWMRLPNVVARTAEFL